MFSNLVDFRGFAVKKIISLALVTLCLFTLSIQPFVFAQQRNQPATGSAAAGHVATGSTAAGRRMARSSTAIPLIERDFDEALRLIEENYVDGKKLD